MKCSEILYSAFDDVAKSDEFQELTFAEITSYIKDLQETDLNPDQLLEAIFGWVNHKPHERRDNVEGLLQQIPLLYCSPQCFKDAMKNQESIFTKCPGLYKLFSQTLAEIAIQGGVCIKRNMQENKARLLLLCGGGEKSLDVWELDLSMNFAKVCDIPECSIWFSVCLTPEGFVITGGKGSTTCTMFAVSSNSWKQLKSLKKPRHQHASLFFLGKIFVFGGVGSSSVESLDLDMMEWSDEPQFPNAVSNPAVTCALNTIYMLNTDKDPVGETKNQLLGLDYKKKVWVKKRSLPGEHRWGARMIAFRNELLVAGGTNNICACYTPSTDTWTIGNPPTLVHKFGTLVCHGQNLYLIGGRHECVEEYDEDTKSWRVSAFKAPTKEWNLYAVSPTV